MLLPFVSFSSHTAGFAHRLSPHCELSDWLFPICRLLPTYHCNCPPVSPSPSPLPSPPPSPPPQTYRTAVHAFVRCGEGARALQLLQEMVAAGLPPAMSVPDVLVRSVDAALLRECAVAAPTGRLRSFLQDMTASGAHCSAGG